MRTRRRGRSAAQVSAELAAWGFCRGSCQMTLRAPDLHRHRASPLSRPGVDPRATRIRGVLERPACPPNVSRRLRRAHETRACGRVPGVASRVPSVAAWTVSGRGDAVSTKRRRDIARSLNYTHAFPARLIRRPWLICSGDHSNDKPSSNAAPTAGRAATFRLSNGSLARRARCRLHGAHARQPPLRATRCEMECSPTGVTVGR